MFITLTNHDGQKIELNADSIRYSMGAFDKNYTTVVLNDGLTLSVKELPSNVSLLAKQAKAEMYSGIALSIFEKLKTLGFDITE